MILYRRTQCEAGSRGVSLLGVTVYKLAFGVMRALWGHWYGSKSRQEEVCASRLSGVGEEGTGAVRVTFQERRPFGGREGKGESAQGKRKRG